MSKQTTSTFSFSSLSVESPVAASSPLAAPKSKKTGWGKGAAAAAPSLRDIMSDQAVVETKVDVEVKVEEEPTGFTEVKVKERKPAKVVLAAPSVPLQQLAKEALAAEAQAQERASAGRDLVEQETDALAFQCHQVLSANKSLRGHLRYDPTRPERVPTHREKVHFTPRGVFATGRSIQESLKRGSVRAKVAEKLAGFHRNCRVFVGLDRDDPTGNTLLVEVRKNTWTDPAPASASAAAPAPAPAPASASSDPTGWGAAAPN